VQVKRDNLGEFLCPNCNARLCPKAHIFDGKICPYCGWEDPNYQLWQKEQKARLQRPESKKPDESSPAESQYICPTCGASVDAVHKDCPSCGLLGAKYRSKRVAPTGAAAARPLTPIGPLLDKMPSSPAKKLSIKPTRSPLIKELAKAERREWQFPSLRRFVRPVLASLLAAAVISGLVFGGIYATRFFSQNAGHSIKLPFQPITTSTTYTLNKIVVPETGGEIKIISPSSSSGTFEAGSQITLAAIADDCYAFNYWDGIAGSSETATIIMDSNKSITANFRLRDTTPPIISEVKASNNSDISAIITWVTDKPATSQVEYGKTKDYGLSAVSNGEPTTSHKVRLTALQPNTTYYFMVKSTDKCGNQAAEAEMLTTFREIPVGERVGERALDFTLPYYQDDNPESPNKAGKTETLSSYIGKKKIVLNFWSTFCGACIGEFPFIRGIYEDENLADRNSEDSDFAVFTVCIDSKIDEAPARIKTLEGKFVDEAGPFTFPILFDTEGQTKKDYHIWTIPETVFIDTDGIIREIKIGRFQSKEEIEAILKSLD
jgi:peroxiredoxin